MLGGEEEHIQPNAQNYQHQPELRRQPIGQMRMWGLPQTQGKNTRPAKSDQRAVRKLRCLSRHREKALPDVEKNQSAEKYGQQEGERATHQAPLIA